MKQPNYWDGGWTSPSRFVQDTPFLRAEDVDECPGTYDKYRKNHFKLKTDRLCGYCSMKERLEDIDG